MLKLYAGGNRFFLYDRDDRHRDGRENYEKINLLRGDDWEKINFDCDLIYLFTGRTGTLSGFSEYESFIDVNEKILLGLLEAYRRKKSRAKIIFPSTRLVYRGRRGPLAETAEKEFKTVYAMNKYSCENYLKMYAELFSVRYCVFRICVPYGSIVQGRGSYGTVEFFLKQAREGGPVTVYGSGEQKRTFTHIIDLCRALWEGGLSDQCLNDVFNVGGADRLSVGEVAGKIAAAYGVEVRHVPWPEESGKLESGDTVFVSRRLDRIMGKLYEHSIDGWIGEMKEQRMSETAFAKGEQIMKHVRKITSTTTKNKVNGGGVLSRNLTTSIPAGRFLSFSHLAPSLVWGRLPLFVGPSLDGRAYARKAAHAGN